MDLNEARKQVQTPKKLKENFILVTLNYDYKLIIPHKDGVALVAALANAEMLDDTYGSSTRGYIVPVPKDKVVISQLSHQEYERIKIAQLLGISISDLERLEEEELQKNKEPPAP